MSDGPRYTAEALIAAHFNAPFSKRVLGILAAFEREVLAEERKRCVEVAKEWERGHFGQGIGENGPAAAIRGGSE